MKEDKFISQIKIGDFVTGYGSGYDKTEKGGATMKKNELRDIDGKKIRRQYFNTPLIFLFSLMFAIPYSITVFSLALGKYEQYELLSTLKSSVLVCVILSLPFLILRTLNKHFFGKIICVLNQKGIHHLKECLDGKQ